MRSKKQRSFYWRTLLLIWVLFLSAVSCAFSVWGYYAYTIISPGHQITPGYYHAELYWSEQPDGIFKMVDTTPFIPSANPFYLRVVSTPNSSASFTYRLTVTAEGKPCVIKAWNGKEGARMTGDPACKPGEIHTYLVERPGNAALVTVEFSTFFTSAEPLDASP